MRCRRVFDFSARNVGPKRVHPAKRCSRRFAVELPGLRQIGLFVEVIDFEQRRRAFACRGRQDRRVTQRESVVVEEVADALDDFMTDFQDRPLPGGSDPQVAVVHEEFDAMFLGGNRKGVVLGNFLDDFEVRQIHFVSARGARVFANLSCNPDGRFVGQGVRCGKDMRRHRVFHQHTLDISGAVPYHQELNLAAGALVVEPAEKRYFFSDMFAGIFNVDSVHSLSSGIGRELVL